MDEDEIHQLAMSIIGLDKEFIGVIPKNQIPDLSMKSTAKSFIINTDKYGYPGSHWVGIYISQNDYVIYFDSFGIDPTIDPYILNLINKCGKNHLYFSNKQIQSFNSSLCGLYVLYILYLLTYRKFSLKECIDLFDDVNLENNDNMIRHVFKDIFVLLKMNMV